MKISLMLAMLLFGKPSMIINSKEWIKTRDAKIEVYTRPKNFTNTPSPDSTAISNLIDEAKYCIDEANSKLNTKYTGKVRIFIYNYDEAQGIIGTNSGGFQEWKSIYYTYSQKPLKDNIRKRKFFIGPHEFAHMVAFYRIGNAKIRLFKEGYANAIDGTYSCSDADSVFVATPVEDFINMENILTPTQMLNDNYSIPEHLFYSQSGYFVKWLFKSYGVEKVNKIYTSRRKHFESKFEKTMGESFAVMEKKYMVYCDSVFKQ